jgi:hypothetical protein
MPSGENVPPIYRPILGNAIKFGEFEHNAIMCKLLSIRAYLE